MKVIAFEEHYSTEEHLELLLKIAQNKYPDVGIEDQHYLATQLSMLTKWAENKNNPNNILVRLCELGEARIKEMDEAGVDIEVLSLYTPSVQVFDAPTATSLARKLNNELAKAIKKYPGRYVGLAAIAPQDPASAADELKRAVKILGFRGASINSHTKGEYLDDPKYWDIFKMAENLDVPIYLHPRSPSPQMIQPFLTYPEIAGPMFGCAVETALHSLRLMASGVFDEFPKLKIVLGHLGESLPYWGWKLDHPWLDSELGKKRKKVPTQYLKDNFFMTTSGLLSQAALLCVHLSLGAENILFAADHPFESDRQSIQFIKEASIADSDKSKILSTNAMKLLHIE